MKLQFKHQKFQADAAKAVVDVFAGQPYLTPTYMMDRGTGIFQIGMNEEDDFTGWRNQPLVPELSKRMILEQIQEIQRIYQITPSQKLEGEGYNLTIEMETGVGKTYTYIKTMFELNKHYGWSKFIVVVPSIAIREGVYKSFEVTQEHFAEEYGKKIRFFIYNSAQLTEIDRFASDNSINVMIINSQAFNARGKDARRIYMKLDEFFAAKRLAYSLIGEKDDSRIEFIQFHQNYSYEDFIMGYKPQEQGFKLTNGIFYRFCMTAADHPEKDYYFIIDEINRGNMSKIFGELLMLIEKDYRGTKATLAYSSTTFSVPKNLYMIGMMNTADRSLAMIDYALRRRFSFYEMEPGFHSEGFKAYQASLQNETFNVLIEQIVELNREINADDSLGAGFRIGHSYFCGQKECTEEWMKSVVYYDIIPMLQEYWFDDRQKVQRWENLLIGVFND